MFFVEKLAVLNFKSILEIVIIYCWPVTALALYHCQRCDILSITNGLVYWKIPLSLAATACLKMAVH